MAITIIILTTAVVLTLFSIKLYQRRVLYKSIPQLPTSFLWGHLKAMDELSRAVNMKPDQHPDYLFREAYERLGRPAMMLFDLWPVSDPVLVSCHHEVAEQISKPSRQFPYSLIKGETSPHLVPLFGPRSMVHLDGEEWKQVRKKYNGAFSHQTINAFIPTILDKALRYTKNLERFASTGEVVPLLQHTTHMTLDIIGSALLGLDFDAQVLSKPQHDLVRVFLELTNTFTGVIPGQPTWLTPLITFRRRRLGRAIDRLLNKVIIDTKKQTERPGFKATSILAIRLQDVDVLTPQIMDETRDQIKILLVGGHDTVSIVLSYTFYLLSRYPRVLSKLRAELDEVLGKGSTDPMVVREKLLSPEAGDLMSQMQYTNAVIKEVLRLYPPAGTGRTTPPNTHFNLIDPFTGLQHKIDGCTVYNSASLIQRNAAVYGESADQFLPERWLTDVSMDLSSGKLSHGGAGGGNLPASAWRPFERGPRACIGQDLAVMEARLVVAMVVGRFEFEKVGLGSGRGGEGEELYNIIQITSKPADMMRMKVRLAKRGE